MTQSFSSILAPCTPISAKVWAGLTGVSTDLAAEGGGSSVASSVVAVVAGVERVVPAEAAVVGVGTGTSSFKFSRIRSTLPSLLFGPDAGGGSSVLPRPL